MRTVIVIENNRFIESFNDFLIETERYDGCYLIGAGIHHGAGSAIEQHASDRDLGGHRTGGI